MTSLSNSSPRHILAEATSKRGLAGYLDRTTGIPLYLQLKQIVLGWIEQGELSPNDPIPTEDELCERFGVSRTTVRQAIGDLIVEGHLYRRRGKGTYVTPSKIQDAP